MRTALSKAIDRSILVEVGYGAGGKPTCNVIPGPEDWASDNDGCIAQDMEGAKALLEEAGWTDSDGDGIRDKDGKKLKHPLPDHRQPDPSGLPGADQGLVDGTGRRGRAEGHRSRRLLRR